MDKKDDNTTPGFKDNDTSPNNGQVMDIQAPKSITVTSDGTVQDASAGTDTAPTMPQDSNDAGGTTALPVEPSPNPASGSDAEGSGSVESLSEESTPTNVGNSPEPDTASSPVSGANEADGSNEHDQKSPTDQGSSHADNPLAIPPQAAHHASGVPMAAIAVAIFIALALAGGVIFAYTKNKNNTQPGTATNTTTQTVQKPQASASDVDATDKEIDKSLSQTDEATDFPGSELSDTSLGL